jgi:transcription antitermination factor NusG
MPRAPKTLKTPSPKEHAPTDRAGPRAPTDHAEPKAGRKSARAKSPLSTHAETHSGIELGARVRVVVGPFSGKGGVVQELDARGGARVKLGLLVVRFELEHLMPQAEGRARPMLGTSHRKPLPARS